MWEGGLEVNLSFLIGSFLVGILPFLDCFYGNFHEIQLFLFSKVVKSMAQVAYYKLLTNLACSNHTEEYWPIPTQKFTNISP